MPKPTRRSALCWRCFRSSLWPSLPPSPCACHRSRRSKANAEALLSGDPSFSQPQFSEAPSHEPTPPQEQCQAFDFAGPPLPAGSLTISVPCPMPPRGRPQRDPRADPRAGNSMGASTTAMAWAAVTGLADGSYQVSFYDNSGQYQSVFYDAGSLVLSPPTAPSVVLAGRTRPRSLPSPRRCRSTSGESSS